MNSKVSSDWLPSYIRATRPVLEIFKMAGYFPDSPRVSATHVAIFRMVRTLSAFNYGVISTYNNYVRVLVLTIRRVTA